MRNRGSLVIKSWPAPPSETCSRLNSYRMSWDEIPMTVSLREIVHGLGTILTCFGSPRSFLWSCSCGQETCLLIASRTEGTMMTVMFGTTEQRRCNGADIHDWKAVF